MSDQNSKKISSKRRVTVAFRAGPSVKTLLENMAYEQNLEASDLYRQVFYAGLKSQYGIDVVGNEIVSPDSQA